MNLIKKLNEVDKEIQEFCYNNIFEYFDFIEQYMSFISNFLISSLEHEIKKTQTKKEFDEIIEKYRLFNTDTVLTCVPDDVDEKDVIPKTRILNLQNGALKIYSQHYKLINEYTTLKYMQISKSYIKSKNDIKIFNSKRMFLTNKYLNMMRSLKKELIDDALTDIIDFIKEYGEILQQTKKFDDFINKLPELPIEVENKTKTPQIQKIFDYKNLQNIAINNGYKYKWSSGDHNIYEHPTTKNIVVIPAHKIGLGLSIKIQKQIYNNK